jgi:hypothetical protein
VRRIPEAILAIFQATAGLLVLLAGRFDNAVVLAVLEEQLDRLGTLGGGRNLVVSNQTVVLVVMPKPVRWWSWGGFTRFAPHLRVAPACGFAAVVLVRSEGSGRAVAFLFALAVPQLQDVRACEAPCAEAKGPIVVEFETEFWVVGVGAVRVAALLAGVFGAIAILADVVELAVQRIVGTVVLLHHVLTLAQQLDRLVVHLAARTAADVVRLQGCYVGRFSRLHFTRSSNLVHKGPATVLHITVRLVGMPTSRDRVHFARRLRVVSLNSVTANIWVHCAHIHVGATMCRQ